MELKEITITKNWKGRKIAFHGIKAYACNECDEVALSMEDISLMERLTESLPDNKEIPETMDAREFAKYYGLPLRRYTIFLSKEGWKQEK